MANTKNTYALRLFTYSGHYPKESITTKEDLYSYDQESDIVYTLVKLNNEDIDLRGVEVFWAHLSEVRFWSSIILSVDPDEGKIALFPHEGAYTYNYVNPSGGKTRKKQIANFIQEVLDKMDIDLKNPQASFVNSHSYSFRTYSFNFEAQRKIYSKIDLKDYLLIRGLSCLIKSRLLLMASSFFFEEAIITAYISLEASLITLRESLSKQYGKKFSKLDTLSFLKEQNQIDLYSISEALHNEEGEDSYYYLRNRIIHPGMNTEEECMPSLLFEDFIEIYDTIVSLYRFVLLRT